MSRPTVNQMFEVAEEVLSAIAAGYDPEGLALIVESLNAHLEDLNADEQKAMRSALKQMRLVLRGPGNWPSNTDLKKARQRLQQRA